MKTPSNTNGSFAGLSLSPAVQTQVRLAAQTPGNNLDNVEAIARADVRATQGGGSPATQVNLDAEQRRKAAEQMKLAAAVKLSRHTEPKVIVKGKSEPMGTIGWLMVLLLLVGLLAALWVENGAASQVLMSLGAFDVDTIEKARMVMLTPVVVGIALVLGYKVLPVFIRRPFFIGACSLLVMLFLTWAVCFAIQSEGFRNEAAQGVSLSDDSGGGESGDEDAAAAGEGGWSSWLMFGCLASIMCLTTFIGHTGVEHVVQRYETWTTNGEHTRALDDAKFSENEIAKHEKEIARLTQQKAAYEAEEEQAVGQARTLYKHLSQGGDIPSDDEPPAAGATAVLTPQPFAPAPGNAVAMPTATDMGESAA